MPGADNYYLQVSADAAFTSIVFGQWLGFYNGVDLSGFPDNGHRYYWRVAAGNVDGASPFSGVWSVVNGPSAIPDWPYQSLPLDGASVPGTMISFEWYPAARASNYLLQVSTDSYFSDLIFNNWLGNVSGVDLSGFADDDTVYWWRIAASNTLGTTDYSFIRSVINTASASPATPSLSLPADGAKVDGTAISFSWSPAARANDYYVQVATDTGFANVVFGQWIGNYSGITLTGLPDNGQTFYWRVQARNSIGSSAFSLSRTVINGPSAIPATPVLNLPANGANAPGTDITFSWGVAARANDYYVQVATDAGFANVVFGKWIGNYSGIILTGLPDNGQTFYWRVQARNSLGSTSFSAAFNLVNGPSAIPAIPTAVSPLNNAAILSEVVDITWQASDRASKYYLEVAIDSGFTNKIFQEDVGNVTTKRLSFLANIGVTHYWRVTAGNSLGWSGYSTVGSFIYYGLSSGCTPQVGTGTGMLINQTHIDTCQSQVTGKYYLLDITRRQNQTADLHPGLMQANAQIETHYAGNGLMEDADNQWLATSTQAEGIDAQVYAAYSYDFLFNSLEPLNGVNDQGTTMRSTVNYGCTSVNAYYNPATRELYFCAGTATIRPWPGALDVVGHEWGHAVTNEAPVRRTGPLIYEYDSGALNEAFSDWMGTAVEHYKGEINWTLGEGIRILRDLSNPLLHGQPDTYGGSCTTTCPPNWYITATCTTPSSSNDHCGVHTNSGVGNKMFYLLSVGGTHATSGVSVTGIGITKAMRIAKRANLYHWTKNDTNYLEARTGMVDAATVLYGAASNEVVQVNRAWDAVKVP